MFHFNYCKTKIVQTEDDLIELKKLMNKAKYYFFDTETSGLKVRLAGNSFTVGFTIAFEEELDERVFYVPLHHEFEGEYIPRITNELIANLKLDIMDFPYWDESIFYGEWNNIDEGEFLSFAKKELESGKHFLIAHNIGFDFHPMANMGLDIEKIVPRSNFDDTMIMHHTFDEEGEKKLEKIVEHEYGVKKVDYNHVVATVTNEEKKSVGMKANQKATFQYVQIPIGAQYSAEDVWFMRNMYQDMIAKVKEDEQWDIYRKVRIPFCVSLWRMERRGARVDLVRIKEMEVLAKEALDAMAYEMYEIIGDCEINFNSGQQMGELLYGHKKKLKEKTGGYKESYNAKYVELSFKFPITYWTEGGKSKDKQLKNPQVNEDSLLAILEKDYNKDKRKREGQDLVRILLKYNRLKKLYEGFIMGIQEQLYQDNKVHPSFNQCGTDSWRLSCSEPNLQQLPKPLEVPKEPRAGDFNLSDVDSIADYKKAMKKYAKEKAEYDYWIRFEIRSLIIPDDDMGEEMVIISADYSNLEKRITAHMTEDSALVELLNNNYDGHGYNATKIFPEELDGVHPNDVKKVRPDLRQIAKTVGFAIDYGGTEFTVSKNLGISKEDARVLIDNYFEGFAGIAEWDDNQKRFGRKYGYVQTILGHKRHVGGLRSDNMKIKSYYERIVLNAPIQGSAGDIISLAQLNVDKDPVLRLLRCTLRIQIHDELVAVCPKKYVNICMDRLKYWMANSLPEPLIVPLYAEADWSTTYSGAH